MVDAGGLAVAHPADQPCLAQLAACGALCNDSSLYFNAGAPRTDLITLLRQVHGWPSWDLQLCSRPPLWVMGNITACICHVECHLMTFSMPCCAHVRPSQAFRILAEQARVHDLRPSAAAARAPAEKGVYQRVGEATEVALRVLAEKVGLPGYAGMPGALGGLPAQDRATFCNDHWQRELHKARRVFTAATVSTEAATDQPVVSTVVVVGPPRCGTTARVPVGLRAPAAARASARAWRGRPPLCARGRAHMLDAPARQVSTLEFSRDRKMMSVRCRQGDRDVLFVKGAPESVLACCTHVRAPAPACLGHAGSGQVETRRPSLPGPSRPLGSTLQCRSRLLQHGVLMWTV